MDLKKVTKSGLKPKCRFPEFLDAPDWVEKALKETAFINPSHEGLPDSFVYIDLESVEAGQLKAKSKISRRSAPSRAQRLIKFGDIIYQIVRPYQKNNLLCEFNNDNQYVASTGYAQIRARECNKFLYQIVHTDEFTNKVILKCTGSSYPAISSSDLAEINLSIPQALLEQQKIADCLSFLDQLIAAQDRKLDVLKVHKKGLMQQFFPREGETQPSLRFSEFRKAPKWEEDKAGVLFMNRTEDGEVELPIYSVTMNDGMVKRTSLGRDFDDIAEPAGNKKVYEGDIAYNMMRMWQGAFGVAIEDCMVSPAYVVLAPRKGVHPNFFVYLLKLPKCLQLLTSHSQGLTKDRLRLYYKDFARIPLSHPAMPEQQKIADCLSSLDELIAVQVQKLEALKTHKKALMQQLFPVPVPEETET